MTTVLLPAAWGVASIRRGAKGPRVSLLQGWLCKAGVAVTIDGDFGANTEAAVRRFQANHRLSSDGIVGEQTWQALAHIEGGACADIYRRARGEMHGSDSVGFEVPPRDAMIYAACKCIGAPETPTGSNRGPVIDMFTAGWYGPATQARLGAPPWCALFVSWAVLHGYEDFGVVGGRQAAALALEEAAKAKRGQGVWIPRVGMLDTENVTGTIFTMNRSGSGSDASTTSAAGHTGFVLARDPKDPAYVLTVEGNLGDMVQTSRRKITTLRGFIRLP